MNTDTLERIARTELRLPVPRAAPFPTDSSHSDFFTISSGEKLLLAKAIRDDYLSASPRTVLHEHAVMTLVHRAGLAPEPLHADFSLQLLVQEFIPGPPLGAWSDGNITTCARLGEQLTRIDVSAAGLSHTHLRFADDIATHVKTLRDLPASRHDGAQSDLQRLAARAHAFCQRAQAALDELPLVLSHNDLSPENVIQSPRGLVVIDFETSAVSRPDFLVGQIAVDAAIDDALHATPVRTFEHLTALVLGELANPPDPGLCRARIVERLLQNAVYALRQAVRFAGAPAEIGEYAAKKQSVAAFCRTALDHCLGSW
jgi:tRNA A-37 threonylcarbamoyl transferase component Bud32